jgi:cytochrome c oxidase subunit 3
MSETAAALREPWETLPRQREAATFGLWVFLASELLFFGGLLLCYAVFRVIHTQGFDAGAHETNPWFGTANTAVLLTSSLTMAMAARGGEAGLRRTALWCLAATAALGLTFLVIKGFEYREDIVEHLVPGPGFKLAEPAAQLFFSLYWVMTGLHAIHLTIGIGLVTRLWILAKRERLLLAASPQVEITALYWHLVDVIWIILYPLLYLVGRT